ncbi:MAG: 5'-methylthioadenosine/adenosylhomocysteine nucleosidase [Candidatus Izemoplasmatales bacterium]
MIGIIGAMDKEIDLLLSQMSMLRRDEIADKIFYIGNVAGKEIVIVKSGIGKVNATITTTLLLNNYDIEYVLNIGIAGGIDPVKTGEIVLASEVSYFDVSLTAIDDVPYGQMIGDPLSISTDPTLLQKAKYIFEDKGIKAHIGGLVSGDQFVTDIEILKPIMAVKDKVISCEMEGMAIAITCYKFHTPFLSIRGISDIVSSSNQQQVYQDISEKIANQTSEFVIHFLEVS